MNPPICNKCKKFFSKHSNLKRHYSTCFTKSCDTCGKTFTKSTSYNSHVSSCTFCDKCNSVFNKSVYKRHSLVCQANSSSSSRAMKRSKNDDQFQRKKFHLYAVPQDEYGLVITSSLNDSVKNICFKNMSNTKDLESFLEEKYHILLHHLNKTRQELTSLFKCNILLECTYIKHNQENEQVTDAKVKTIDQSTDLEEYIVCVYDKLLYEVEEFESSGSGWRLFSIDAIIIRLTKFRPLLGKRFIPLPKVISDKHAVINIDNNDDFCFKYSILCQMLDKPYTSPKIYNKLHHLYNFDAISFPPSLKDINIFEKCNNVSVNVYALTDKMKVFPMKISTNSDSVQHFDLLYLTDKFGNKSHYCFIKNLSHLVSSQLSKHKDAKVICKRCFKTFGKNERICGGIKNSRRKISASSIVL